MMTGEGFMRFEMVTDPRMAPLVMFLAGLVALCFAAVLLVFAGASPLDGLESCL